MGPTSPGPSLITGVGSTGAEESQEALTCPSTSADPWSRSNRNVMLLSWAAVVAIHCPLGLKAMQRIAEVWIRRRYVTWSGLEAPSARETNLQTTMCEPHHV